MQDGPDDSELRTIWWENEAAYLIDQTLLPGKHEIRVCRTVEEIWEAVRVLRIRGAPAIGVAAAYGVCLGVRGRPFADSSELLKRVEEVADYLATCRPTAVNLFWALERMKQTALDNARLPPDKLSDRLLQEAHSIRDEDDLTCREIGRHGSDIIEDGQAVLTHCNAGGLATASYGTALAVFFRAHESGKRFEVFADETRPLLQGARLTTWELQRHGIPVTLICDNMAPYLMKLGRIHVAVVGADRIAANGDAANKIGTYGVALAAHAHQIPFYVAAPRSTIDCSIRCGEDILIEERSADEVLSLAGVQIAPTGTRVTNPAFDVTPAELIAGIITETEHCQ